MGPRLQAFISSQKVGEISLSQDNQLEFRYIPEWVMSRSAHPISLSMPLGNKAYKGKKINAYFQSLARLPENQNATPEDILQKLRTECPGGLSFHMVGETPDLGRGKYALLGQSAFEKIMTTGEDENDNVAKRNQLGQNLLSIITHQGNLYVPRDSSPSMFQLKMPSDKYPGLIENEFVCMKMAAALGLRVTDAKLQKHGRAKYLMAERSDRFYDPTGALRVIHQETLAQSLGATNISKKQLFSYKNCLKLITENSFYPARDKLQFVKLMVFTLLIGDTNLDCEGVSFNIDQESVSLSKFSGLLSSVIYEGEFSDFRIPFSGVTRLEDLSVEKLKAFCKEIGIPYKFFHKELMSLADKCSQELNNILKKFHQDPLLDFQTLDKMKTIISKRCELVKNRF